MIPVRSRCPKQETGANFVKHEKNIEGMRAEIAGLTTQASRQRMSFGEASMSA